MADAPYTFAEATRLVNDSKTAQRLTEDLLRSTSKNFAEAEKAYRIALASEIVRQHAEEKVAWTACQDLARGAPAVANLRMLRDIAEGVREASQQQAWRAAADRKDLTQLVGWSMRRDLAEDPGPAQMETFGRRAA
jgi:hypothetical protein